MIKRAPRRPIRYAALTYHPNGREGSLLVHSWHATDEQADLACLRLATEFSETREDGAQVILPSLAGLAVVAETDLEELVPGQEWTWARRTRRRRSMR